MITAITYAHVFHRYSNIHKYNSFNAHSNLGLCLENVAINVIWDFLGSVVGAHLLYSQFYR